MHNICKTAHVVHMPYAPYLESKVCVVEVSIIDDGRVEHL